MLNKCFKLLSISFLFCYAINSNAATSNTICPGNARVPMKCRESFREIVNPDLLKKALGKPNEGKLCQGKVYVVKKDLTIYRAWNSTNSKSEKGNWWAFNKPKGEISQYRANYEICYQWSPLDKLVTCTLKKGTEVVVGTGQSAECSKYLIYPASESKQIYIDNPTGNILANCTRNVSTFNWQ